MGDAQDEAYGYYKEVMSEPPYEWEDGSIVADNDYPLFFLAYLFSGFAEQGKVDFMPLRHREGRSIDESVVLSLTGESQEYRDQVERSAANLPKVGVLAGETLRPNFWPLVLKDLPNASGIAWAYSPKRDDYAGAMYLPEQPKKFMKSGRAAGTLRCNLQSDFKKIMQDLAPH